MSSAGSRYSFGGGDDDSPLLPRRPLEEDTSLDLAPMIDVTFLLLIFFLVTSMPEAQRALSLPPAEYGVAVDPRAALVLTIASRGPGRPAIYLADGRVGEPLADEAGAQEEAIGAATAAALRQGRAHVLIKAERDVPHGEVARVSRIAASAAPGIRLNYAVLETD